VFSAAVVKRQGKISEHGKEMDKESKYAYRSCLEDSTEKCHMETMAVHGRFGYECADFACAGAAARAVTGNAKETYW
jgi:hypothetical protein